MHMQSLTLVWEGQENISFQRGNKDHGTPIVCPPVQGFFLQTLLQLALIISSEADVIKPTSLSPS
jgi:hypothetical protein